MKQFSIERKPLVESNVSYYILPPLTIVWVLLPLCLILTSILSGILTGYDHHPLVVVTNSFKVLSTVFIPIVHRQLFSDYYKKIECIFDIHIALCIFAVLVILEAAVGGAGGSCAVVCVAFNVQLSVYVLINILTLTSCCNYFFSKLERLSLVEEDNLLSYDAKRIAIHDNFVSNLTELKSVALRYETIMYTDVALFAILILLNARMVSMNYTSLFGGIVNLIVLMFVSYRNFFFVCQWNSMLMKLESVNSLRFDNLKIKCLGATITYEMLIGAVISMVGILCKDLIAAV